MKLIFLGVGEAFDETMPNTSILTISEKTNLLLDCGYSIPPQLWKFNSDQLFLDAIYITHGHADHYFGIPALFVRMWEEERKKPITVICQKGLKKTIKELMEYGYKGFAKNFKFKINFIEVEEGQIIQFNDLKLLFAPTIHSATKHSAKNLAIKIGNGEKSFCYSGDGGFNEKTEKLYKDSDLVIHEAYLYDEKRIEHGCITDLIEMAQRNNIKCLALTHINRFLRRKELESIKKKISDRKVKVIFPNPFEEFIL